jgi:hypothetical protein
VIEVGELTVRVGRGKLKNAGERPARGSATDGITIEHSEGGAKIEIASDGKITIHAKKNLELISDADITMKAKNVDVAVDSAMNVH